jgi:histone H1/5
LPGPSGPVKLAKKEAKPAAEKKTVTKVSCDIQTLASHLLTVLQKEKAPKEAKETKPKVAKAKTATKAKPAATKAKKAAAPKKTAAAAKPKANTATKRAPKAKAKVEPPVRSDSRCP